MLNRMRPVAFLAAGLLLAVTAFQAFAEDVSESHLKAARAAVAAIRATDIYDAILPAAAAALKQSLIEKNPDLQEIIIKTVDEQAIGMAGRRADLEKEAALAYAKVFSEEDLNAIAGFYTSETGKKLLDQGPIVTRDLVKAADIWQRGVARDLADAVGKVLSGTAAKGAGAGNGAQDNAAPAADSTQAPAQ